MSVITPAKPDQADLEALTAVRDILQGSGGLLYGRYSARVSGVQCYCIVGAIREVIYSGEETIWAYDKRQGKLRHLANLIAETIPSFDPANEAVLEARVQQTHPDPSHVDGMSRIFAYNDYVLYSFPLDSKTAHSFDEPPDVNARIKAIGLLDATISRCQELI